MKEPHTLRDSPGGCAVFQGNNVSALTFHFYLLMLQCLYLNSLKTAISINSNKQEFKVAQIFNLLYCHHVRPFNTY